MLSPTVLNSLRSTEPTLYGVKTVQEQINKIEIETINNDKIQKAVIDFMQQQSKVPITEQQSNRNHNNSTDKDNQVDKSDTRPRFREEKQIKCDIAVLFDSNGKYLQKTNFPYRPASDGAKCHQRRSLTP